MANAWPLLSILHSLTASIVSADWFRLGLVYVHLIACCVAIGLVLTSDVSFVARMLKGDSRQDPEHLKILQRTVSISLALLWLSGLAVVAHDAALSGWDYFLNPKIQAKVVIVCLLTLNGMVLHKAVLPGLMKTGALLELSFSRKMLALFTGSVSGVSWFYAAMLGIGRPLNWKYPLTDLLGMYPVFIGAAFTIMLLLAAWAKYRTARRAPSYLVAS